MTGPGEPGAAGLREGSGGSDGDGLGLGLSDGDAEGPGLRLALALEIGLGLGPAADGLGRTDGVGVGVGAAVGVGVGPRPGRITKAGRAGNGVPCEPFLQSGLSYAAAVQIESSPDVAVTRITKVPAAFLSR